MGERFKNSRDRLDRARIHHRAFDEEWRTLLNTEGTTAEIREDKSPGWNILSACFPPERVERIRINNLALILGEYAYQLRSALDGLIWDAVTYTQGTELSADTKGLHRLEFPLSPTWRATDTDKERFNGFPFPQSLIDWMKTIQPSAADKLPGDADYGLKATLEDIHNLARFDRHRRLRLVAALPTKMNIELLSTTPPGCGISDHEWLDCNPLDGKYDFARVKSVGPGSIIPYALRIRCNLTFDIFAESVGIYPGDISQGDQFFRFLAAVEQVINRFAKEFG